MVYINIGIWAGFLKLKDSKTNPESALHSQMTPFNFHISCSTPKTILNQIDLLMAIRLETFLNFPLVNSGISNPNVYVLDLLECRQLIMLVEYE